MKVRMGLGFLAVAGLTGCAWLPSEEQPPVDNTRSLQHQDPHWQRFYELEQEITRLRQSNHYLRQQVGAGDRTVATAAPPKGFPRVDDVLVRIRHQADSAIARLDSALAQLNAASAADQEKTEAVTFPAANPTVVGTTEPSSVLSGTLERDAGGDVVASTQDEPPRYNYSVVYVYTDAQPWHRMWEKLDHASEQDKWRGSHRDSSRFFIYVGAYFREEEASRRQDMLSGLVGERPQMRRRETALLTTAGR